MNKILQYIMQLVTEYMVYTSGDRDVGDRDGKTPGRATE